MCALAMIRCCALRLSASLGFRLLLLLSARFLSLGEANRHLQEQCADEHLCCSSMAIEEGSLRARTELSSKLLAEPFMDPMAMKIANTMVWRLMEECGRNDSQQDGKGVSPESFSTTAWCIPLSL